jgi:hypothetical protein
MKKLLSIVSLVFLAQLSFAGHHESGHMQKNTVIGYEIWDGEKLDIIAGDPSHIKIWVNYVEAHNQRDLEAIDKANAANFEGKAANGVIINGAEAHATFLKEWFATSNPSWKYIHHWVTSSYTVTDIIDGKKVVSDDLFDVRIEDKKILKIYVASRAVLAENE